VSSIHLVSHRNLRALLAGLALAGGASAQQQLFKFTGSELNDLLGYSIAAAGDLNGDGAPDLLVGAPSWGPGNQWLGRVYALSGKGGAVLRTWEGTTVGNGFGDMVASVGDIDLDGTPDIVIGSPGSSINGFKSGEATVYSGADGSPLFFHFAAPAGVDLGYSAAGLGDLTGDGVPDYAIGAAAGFLPGGFGHVYVYSGTGGLIADLVATQAGSSYGASIDDAGDVNGDGLHDLIIGAQSHSVGPSGGRFEVRSGANLATILFAANGDGAESLGRSVTGAGDVNGDGFADVAVGAYFHGNAAGQVRIYYGPSGAPGWIMNGDAAGDHMGGCVDGAGDVDKDGYDDVLVGAYQSGFSTTLAGYVRVISGRTGQPLYQTLVGQQGGEVFGASLAGLGDVNGDGWVDFAVGADDFNVGAADSVGEVRVYDWIQHATNLGFGGPGTAKLEMYGSPLDSFGQMDLALSGAKPNAQAWLLASATQQLVSFKGGVLVPQLAGSVLVPLVTNVGGKIVIPGILGGLGNVAIHLQYVIKDAAQPFGFAMSNAVKAQFLP
jgi:hypothetical protein